VKSKLKRLIVALAMMSLTASPALAVRVQPMAYDLTPTGSGASKDLRVENTGDKPMPVELKVERRQILPDGSEKRIPAEDDFLIFPPQGIVPPNGFQTFRVQYVGDPAIRKTVLYVVTVVQLPIDTSGEKSTGVQFLFNMGTLAAVSPDGARPQLEIVDVKPAVTAAKLRIEVKNSGNGYARLRNGVWTLTGGDGKVETLEGEALSNALAQPLIEPETSRIIELPVSAAFVREGAKASFSLQTAAK
jgi:fimbrial chaperone protein